ATFWSGPALATGAVTAATWMVTDEVDVPRAGVAPETTSWKTRSPAPFGAVKLGVAVAGLASVTGVPAVWVQTQVLTDPVEPEPPRVTGWPCWTGRSTPANDWTWIGLKAPPVTVTGSVSEPPAVEVTVTCSGAAVTFGTTSFPAARSP